MCEPIRHQIFYGTHEKRLLRTDVGKILVEQIQSAHSRAEAWIRETRNLEVISISNGCASYGDLANIVFVTVWYRVTG